MLLSFSAITIASVVVDANINSTVRTVKSWKALGESKGGVWCDSYVACKSHVKEGVSYNVINRNEYNHFSTYHFGDEVILSCLEQMCKHFIVRHMFKKLQREDDIHTSPVKFQSDVCVHISIYCKFTQL